ARAACTELAAELGTGALDEPALERGVHVLVVGRGAEGARGHVGVEPVQRGEHAVALLVAQQPGAVQHPGVRAGSRDVVAGEPPAEVRRDAHRRPRVRGAAREPAAPQADPPPPVPAHACSPSCRPSWSRSPSASARNRAAVAAPPSGSVVITSTVSSPAIEPSTCGITDSSIAE